MNVYEEYSKTKLSIKLLQDKLKELEPQILEEIKNLTAPMKTQHGTFSKVVRVSYKFSKTLLEEETKLNERIKPLFEEIATKKEQEIKTGVAEKEESISIRFVEEKK